MIEQLQELVLAFRGLSDEDEEEAGDEGPKEGQSDGDSGEVSLGGVEEEEEEEEESSA